MHCIAIPYVQHCKAMIWCVGYVSLITLPLINHILGKSLDGKNGYFCLINDDPKKYTVKLLDLWQIWTFYPDCMDRS